VLSGLAGGVIAALVFTMLPVTAATGDNMVVGEANRSGRSTWLTSRGPSVMKLNNTGGNPVLDLRNGGAAAPLVVDSNRRVTSLNVDRVDSLHANQLVRVAHAETDQVIDTAVFGDGSNGTLLSTKIQAPTPGLLFIVGGTDAWVPDSDPSGDMFRCMLRVNKTYVTGTGRDTRPAYIDSSHTSNMEDNCSTNGVQEVPAGSHTVDLYVEGRNTAAPQADFWDASLQVLFVPFGANGGMP
jgi:hypothetical protein